jgi:hypothetical protein
MTAAPPEELSIDRLRFAFTKGEMRFAADDASALRMVLDAIELSDQVERFLSFGMLALLVEFAPSMGEAAGSRPESGLGDCVVAGVLVDDEAPW